MNTNKIDIERIPRHIAIIMDGNGRWASEQGKPRSFGHQAGVDTVRRITSECTRLGVKYLTLYTFSTENWNRPADEISALMGLVLSSLEDEIFMKNNVRFRVIGDVSRLPEDVQRKLRETEEHTAANKNMTMVVALSYSSRWEIAKAVRHIAKEAVAGNINVDDIDEETVSRELSRSRSADQNGRRVAHLQLSALADSLFRTVFLRYLLARFRQRRPAQGHSKLSETPT